MVNEVTYFSCRRWLAGVLACLGLSAGCASHDLQIVTPYSKHITGPRSFGNIEKEIQAQAQPFRDLYFRVQADYPHFINSYKVDLVIDPDGDLESVKLIDRDFLFREFDDEFMHLVKNLQFSECDCPPTRIVYTFRFASQLPSVAKTEAQLESERRETERRENARKSVDDENATLRIIAPSVMPLPASLGPVGDNVQASAPESTAPGEPAPEPKPEPAKPESKKDRKAKPSKDRVNPDPIPDEPAADPNAPDMTLTKEPSEPPSGPASPQEIPPSPE